MVGRLQFLSISGTVGAVSFGEGRWVLRKSSDGHRFDENGAARGLNRTSPEQNGACTGAPHRFPILVCGSGVDAAAEGANKGQHHVGGHIFKKPEGLRALRLH